MFQNFSINFTKNIKRRVITNKVFYFKNQIRLTNIQLQTKKPTRFIYRITYYENGNFTRHLISEE